MQNLYARPHSPESSLKQKTTKNIIKSNPNSIKDPTSRSDEPAIERLADLIQGVFLDPVVGEVFRFLYQVAHANLSPSNSQNELAVRLVLGAAYTRAMKVVRRG
jgi:hypothetical protein